MLTAGRPVLSGRVLSARLPGGALGWQWELAESELKMTSAPVTEPQGRAAYRFPYRLRGGFAPFAVDADGNLSNGTWLFGRPFLQGADGESYEVGWWEVRRGEGLLILYVDDTRLPAAAYPYRIDPPFGPQLGTLAANFAAVPFDSATVTWNNPQRALTNNNAKAKARDLAPEPSPSPESTRRETTGCCCASTRRRSRMSSMCLAEA